MEDKKDNLYIPANIKTRLEFFKGFGVKELVITLIVMAISLPIIFVIYKLKGTILAVIVFFLVTAGTFISLIKDDNNLCMMEQIRFMIKKSKRQKRYKYKYFDKRGSI